MQDLEYDGPNSKTGKMTKQIPLHKTAVFLLGNKIIPTVTPPGLLPSVRALVRVRVSVTIITRRGSCGLCPSFVTTIYTRAHRRWWRVSTV